MNLQAGTVESSDPPSMPDVLDRARQTIRRDGKNLPLNAKETAGKRILRDDELKTPLPAGVQGAIGFVSSMILKRDDWRAATLDGDSMLGKAKSRSP